LWIGMRSRSILRSTYLGICGLSAVWLWNPLRLMAVRNHDEVGLTAIPLALAAALVAEAMLFRRPKRFWKHAIRLVAIGIGSYGAFVGVIVSQMISHRVTTVRTVSIGNTNAAIVERTMLIDSCRELELHAGAGAFQRFSENTGCLGGEAPSLRSPPVTGSAKVDVIYANCNNVPPTIGSVAVRCFADAGD
jgi:uncharacterized membrane protein